MYTKALIIVCVFIGLYPFVNVDHTSPTIYYTQFSLLISGYFYCILTSLYKLQRASPLHEFQDEEELELVLAKSQ